MIHCFAVVERDLSFHGPSGRLGGLLVGLGDLVESLVGLAERLGSDRSPRLCLVAAVWHGFGVPARGLVVFFLPRLPAVASNQGG